jgi:hypothetical protein
MGPVHMYRERKTKKHDLSSLYSECVHLYKLSNVAILLKQKCTSTPACTTRDDSS